VDLDTGSSDLIVPWKDCKVGCENHTLYDPDASSTSANLNQDFSILFESNDTVFGLQYTDVVSISGYKVCRALLFLFF
jgi:Eukaryotic aspartyl protease